ncbi:hypothetical protein GUITHDRAFT_137051 [Guillardia theta CCMP2712]|uniref:Glycosyl transferase family 1 domain-containing protein n=1 Tax=Guillardia theta (strain CCMP2712) TaxID=905079 RepID=L1JHV7_GUITC|nr:hypothetical protein GUITHDRAFT_137051 [Guillardia theta CCMP2712]EKX48108.1 hypothetical protein GUITHDRAFT_137051 [Guillardia theta CCMP2712]|eukprot:XP_005835088.1 hypothetical protein GUITHDRAFT_137051 [Guillardia theta CCMP2712]
MRGLALVLGLLLLCFHGSLADDDIERIVLLKPRDSDTLPPGHPIVVEVQVSGLKPDSQYTAEMSVDEEDGLTVQLKGDGVYSETLQSLQGGQHLVTAFLFRSELYVSRAEHHFTVSEHDQTEPSSHREASQATESQVGESEASEGSQLSDLRLTISTISPCQVFTETLVVLGLEISRPPPPNFNFSFVVNGHVHLVQPANHTISISAMPDGIHHIFLHAAWIDSQRRLREVRGADIWFSVNTPFNYDTIYQVSTIPHMFPNPSLESELWKCLTHHQKTVVPRLWITLSQAKKYDEAMEYIRLALRSRATEPWFHLAHSCLLWLWHMQTSSCTLTSTCYEGVLEGFEVALDNGLQSVDAGGGINEMVGILDPTTENDNGIALKAALLRAEMRFNRKRFKTDLVRYPDSHPCRNDERPFKQYLEELSDHWGPTKMLKGMGGANEAVVFASRQLVAKGYKVVVYANPGPEDSGWEDEFGVEWHPFWAYDESNRPGVFVIWWHHQDAVDIGRNAWSRYMWFHYRQYTQRYTEDFMTTIDGAFAMSRYHADQMPDYAQQQTIVSANGIDASFFTDGPNYGKRFIYASHPFYGLKTLLKAWPEIHARVPNSTLEVYYGWTPGMLRHIERVGPEGHAFKKSIDEMLEYPGVLSKGMVGQKELTKALSECGFYLYPCEIAEISSISLMRAQAMGAIPITSRFLDSALNETAGLFDLGPPAREGLIGKNPEWLQQWIDVVVDAGNNAERYHGHRQRMKEWARKKFSWERVGRQWDHIFQHGVGEAGSVDIDVVAPLEV